MEIGLHIFLHFLNLFCFLCNIHPIVSSAIITMIMDIIAVLESLFFHRFSTRCTWKLINSFLLRYYTTFSTFRTFNINTCFYNRIRCICRIFFICNTFQYYSPYSYQTNNGRRWDLHPRNRRRSPIAYMSIPHSRPRYFFATPTVEFKFSLSILPRISLIFHSYFSWLIKADCPFLQQSACIVTTPLNCPLHLS